MLVGFDNYFQIHSRFLVVTDHRYRSLAFGVLAGVLTWVAGPSKGIFAVGKAGYMPPFFQKTNKLGVQKNILFVQGIAVTCAEFVVRRYAFRVQSFYQILSQLTVILYLIMYLLMFSELSHCVKMKKLNRPFPYR